MKTYKEQIRDLLQSGNYDPLHIMELKDRQRLSFEDGFDQEEVDELTYKEVLESLGRTPYEIKMIMNE